MSRSSLSSVNFAEEEPKKRRLSMQGDEKVSESHAEERREKMLLRRASTTKAVQSLQASHAKRAASLCSFLERCRNDPSLTDDSPILKFLHVVPARDLSSAFDLPTANNSMCIFDILRIFHNHKYVLLRDWTDAGEETGNGERVAIELVWQRAAFTEVALQADDLYEPVSTIANTVPEIPTVMVGDTLDVVLQTMCLTGSEHVATVNDQGLITGVLSFDKIYESLIHEIEALAGLGEDEPNVNVDQENEDERVKIRNAKDRERIRSKTANDRRQGGIRQAATAWIEAPFTELLVLLMVVVDVSASILEMTGGIGPKDLQLTGIQNPLTAITGTVLIVFIFESTLRLFSLQGSIIWRPLDLVDTLFILISAVIFALTVANLAEPQLKGLVSLGRFLRLFRLIKFAKRLRKIVGANKSRYQRDGFDLDLTYITPSCIAMSLPATGAEAHFRNPIEEVQRFFYTLHPSHFLVFNLCAERTYDSGLFGGSVEKIACEDHNPPRLDQLISFITRVSAFLEQDPDNVFAVHCKGGKGRTGVFVCAWLMFSTYCQSAEAAMEFFANKRTGRKAKAQVGVSGAGQRQYLKYFDTVLSEGGYRTNRLVLEKIVMRTCPRMDTDGGCDPWFSIEENGVKVFDWAAHAGSLENMKAGQAEMVFEGLGVNLFGDIRIRFFDRDYMPRRDEAMFFFWFHTGFIAATPLVLSKPNIDVAWADKRCKIFSDRFQVECHFTRIPKANDTEDERLTSAPSAVSKDSAKAYLRTSMRQSRSFKHTELGPWIPVDGPSFRIQELARKYKGVQPIARGVIDATDELQYSQLEPLLHNYCPADGTPVVHRSVHMYGHDDAGAEGGNFMPQMPNLNLAKAARRKVSGNKRRFTEDGFDLDLTYITPRMIAMGFPSSGFEGQYRNDEGMVYKFFQQRHADHYLIVNLCDERSYSLHTFHEAVVRYPFTDHEPPALELLLLCCAHIHAFLQANLDNVVAVHCKAGKGRTGVVIVASLMYAGLYIDASLARKFYDMRRTFNHYGLTIRSQIRYVHYFEQVLKRLVTAPESVALTQSSAPAVRLHRVRLNTIPHFDLDGGCDPIVRIVVRSEEDHLPVLLFASETAGVHHVARAAKVFDIELPAIRVAGDFAVLLADQDLLTEQKMGSIWLHSLFLADPPDEVCGVLSRLPREACERENLPHGACSLTLKKPHIDGASKDLRDAKFDADFSVELFFSEMPAEFGCGPQALTSRRTSGQDNHVGAQLLDRAREKFRRDCIHAPAGSRVPTFEQWIVKHWSGGDFGEFGQGMRGLARNNSIASRETSAGKSRSKEDRRTRDTVLLARSTSTRTVASARGGTSGLSLPRRSPSPARRRRSPSADMDHTPLPSPQGRPFPCDNASSPRTISMRPDAARSPTSEDTDTTPPPPPLSPRLPSPEPPRLLSRPPAGALHHAPADHPSLRPTTPILRHTSSYDAPGPTSDDVEAARGPSPQHRAGAAVATGNGHWQGPPSEAQLEPRAAQPPDRHRGAAAGVAREEAVSHRLESAKSSARLQSARSYASSTEPWALGRDTHCTLKLTVGDAVVHPKEEFRRGLERDLARALGIRFSSVSCDKVVSTGEGRLEAAIAFFDDPDLSASSALSSPLQRIGAMVEGLVDQACDPDSLLKRQRNSRFVDSVQLSDTLTAALFE